MISYNGQILSPLIIKGSPKPTLNTPSIEFNANGGYMYILDSKNGNFSEGYQLYLNGEKNVILTSTSIKMQDYGIGETDEVGIVAKSELFNNSPMATARWSDLELGTIGLSYSGDKWLGLGTATDTEIYVAGVVNGNTITSMDMWIFKNNTKTLTIHLSNSIVGFLNSEFYGARNKTVIVGASFSKIEYYGIISMQYCVIDLRKANSFVKLSSNLTNTAYNKFIVEDEDYETYITATGWAGIAGQIVKGSIYDASGGTV